jgi:hypothetical protein
VGADGGATRRLFRRRRRARGWIAQDVSRPSRLRTRLRGRSARRCYSASQRRVTRDLAARELQEAEGRVIRRGRKEEAAARRLTARGSRAFTTARYRSVTGKRPVKTRADPMDDITSWPDRTAHALTGDVDIAPARSFPCGFDIRRCAPASCVVCHLSGKSRAQWGTGVHLSHVVVESRSAVLISRLKNTVG